MTRYRQSVILDFDGLLTKLEVEAAHVNEAFIDAVAHELGMAPAQAHRRVEQIMQRLDQEPGAAWTYAGHEVTRWDTDPYTATSTALDELYAKESDADAQQRAAILSKHFRASHSNNSRTAWRPGAPEFVQEINRSYQTVVVTNSATDTVQKRIDEVADVRVHGDAKKIVVDPQYTRVPESSPQTDLEGSRRPVLLRRPHYHHVLESLGDDFAPERTVVAGDSYELDLALPMHLGYGTLLMHPHGRAGNEKERVRRYERGAVSENYQLALFDIAGL